MTRLVAPLAAALCLVTAGCRHQADDPTAVTGDEDRRLNDAAAALDAEAADGANDVDGPAANTTPPVNSMDDRS